MKKRLTLESLIIESPDFVQIPGNKSHYTDDDAIPFGYYEGKLYVGKFGKVHPYIDVPALRNAPYKDGSAWQKDRTDFQLPGRIWIKKGIFSFWEYPSISELQQIIKDLDIVIKETLNYDANLSSRIDKLLIEVIPDKETASRLSNDEDSIWYEYQGDTILVPVTSYEGSKKWSDEIRVRKHIEVGSGGSSVPVGVGSRKEVPGEGSSNVEKRFKMGEIHDIH